MGFLGSDDTDENQADRRYPDSSKDLLVELATGEVCILEPEQWEFSPQKKRLYFGWNSSDEVEGVCESTSSVVNESPPIRVHVPVEDMSARHNSEERSEKSSRMISEVNRYSLIVNPSNHAQSRVDLDSPFIEVWY